MEFKTDTKEKFHAIRVNAHLLSATMTAELASGLVPYLQNGGQTGIPRNIVLNLEEVQAVDNEAATALVALQQQFYEANASFVICGLQKPVEEFLDQLELLELMNVTPTESEAWDIVQMEEIERELLGDE